jgi:hypothetical protein
LDDADTLRVQDFLLNLMRVSCATEKLVLYKCNGERLIYFGIVHVLLIFSFIAADK